MKTLCPILFLLFIACDNEPAYGPIPFDELAFTSKFELPSDRPTSFSELTRYEIRAQMRGQNHNLGGYYYLSSNISENHPDGNGILPDDAAMLVSTDNDLMNVEVSGTMFRQGAHPDELFSGSSKQWTEKCAYAINAKVNLITQQLIEATIVLDGGRYKWNYDLTEKMTFQESVENDIKQWSIHSTNLKCEGVDNANILFWVTQVH